MVLTYELVVQGSEVLSMLYAAHQEGKKTSGVDVEVGVLNILSQWLVISLV